MKEKHCNRCSTKTEEGIEITGCNYCGCHAPQDTPESKEEKCKACENNNPIGHTCLCPHGYKLPCECKTISSPQSPETEWDWKIKWIEFCKVQKWHPDFSGAKDIKSFISLATKEAYILGVEEERERIRKVLTGQIMSRSDFGMYTAIHSRYDVADREQHARNIEDEVLALLTTKQK